VRRRALDPRPPIEVVGADDELASVHRVSTGPGRPTGGRGRALALGVGVIGLLLGGLALGGADDEPSSPTEREERDNRERAEIKPSSTVTTRPRTTTTRPPTTTTTIPVGPVFGQPVGASLLAFGNGRWRLVDLDTGARRELELPSDNPWDGRAVDGGMVLLVGSPRQARYYNLGADIGEPAPVDLGPADLVVSAGRSDRVWLIDAGGRFEGQGTLQTALARLVDLSGTVVRSFEVPGDYVLGGFDIGLVVVRGGRVYLIDEAGARPIAVGDVYGTTSDSVLVFGCDDRAECGVKLHPVDGGPPVVLQSVDGPIDFGYGVVTGPDGQFAILRYPGGTSGGGISFFSADGRLLESSAEDIQPSINGELRWLPGDLGLIAPGVGGIEWIHEVGSEWMVTDVPALDGIAAEILAVIQP